MFVALRLLLSLTFVSVLAAGCDRAGASPDARAPTLDAAVERVDAPPAPDAGGSLADAGRAAPDAGIDAGSLGDAHVERSYDIPAPGSYRFLCDLPPPPGTQAPAALPTYAGTCPALGVGIGGRNTLASGGVDRGFVLVAPAEPAAADERFPVVFLWHHMGSEADTFLQEGYLQAAVDEHRFVAVLPESLDDLGVDLFGRMFGWEWPWTESSEAARIAQEAQFMDDMLACVAAQYPVNEQCVSTGGVSAGGLWQPVLAASRSERIASMISMSGGVDARSSLLDFFAAGPWASTAHRMPVLVAWGGPRDTCLGMDFQAASQNLEAALERDGHALVECVHNCTHSVPPFDPERPFEQLVDFVMNHPYWLADGDSPYLWHGLPSSYPEWCALGAGAATPRTGECLTTNPCERIPGL